MATLASPARVQQRTAASPSTPPVNLHDVEVAAALRDLADRLDADPGVQVVVEKTDKTARRRARVAAR
jgi:hypothetical protein